MPTGLQFLQQYADRLGQLFNASVLPLSAVGGTGDVVTATLDPALTAGLTPGMKFTIGWASANTGPVTLALNGGTAVPVLDPLGAALTAGALQPGQRSLIEYVAGSFVILGSSGGAAGPDPYYAQMTASQTWTRPSGYADDTPVLLEAWGGGASGNRDSTAAVSGGWGGSYSARRLRYADIPSSVSIVIGAGGPPRTSGNGAGTSGGNTTIGSLLTAYGGGAGGQFAGESNAAPYFWDGGAAGTTTVQAKSSVFGGGGGGAGSTNAALRVGSLSKFGGGGGNGADGANASAGSAPGGGGGGVTNAGSATYASGAGARGEVRIWIGGGA